MRDSKDSDCALRLGAEPFFTASLDIARYLALYKLNRHKSRNSGADHIPCTQAERGSNVAGSGADGGAETVASSAAALVQAAHPEDIPHRGSSHGLRAGRREEDLRAGLRRAVRPPHRQPRAQARGALGHRRGGHSGRGAHGCTPAVPFPPSPRSARDSTRCAQTPAR